MTWIFSKDPLQVVEPDLVFVLKKPLSIIGEKNIHGVPDLTIEARILLLGLEHTNDAFHPGEIVHERLDVFFVESLDGHAGLLCPGNGKVLGRRQKTKRIPPQRADEDAFDGAVVAHVVGEIAQAPGPMGSSPSDHPVPVFIALRGDPQAQEGNPLSLQKCNIEDRLSSQGSGEPVSLCPTGFARKLRRDGQPACRNGAGTRSWGGRRIHGARRQKSKKKSALFSKAGAFTHI